MFNFFRKLFQKKGLPKYVENNRYLLVETLKPIIPKGDVLHVGWFDAKLYNYGKKQNVSEAEDGDFDAIVAIDSGKEPEELLGRLRQGGELLYVEAAASHSRWKGKSLKKKYRNATIHPIAIHWWLVHFRT